MSLEWIKVTLRGYGGDEPVGATFFETLGIGENDAFPTTPGDTPWQAALVLLLMVEMDQCLQAEVPSEEFSVRVARGLQQAADWLSQLPLDKMNQWKAGEREADIFVGGWLDDEQFDLTLPPEFLLACGRLGLTLTICTND